MTEGTEGQGAGNSQRGKRRRLIALCAILFGLFAIGYHFELEQRFDPLTLRNYIQGMGSIGVLLYLVLFCLLLLVSVPGMIFMIAAGMIWGSLYGSLVALLGANLAIHFSFYFVRKFQGAGFEADAVRNPFISRMLSGVERNPVKTVATLRFLVSTAPALNYGFALSSVSTRQHLLGTFLGSLVPVVAVVVFSERLFQWLFT